MHFLVFATNDINKIRTRSLACSDFVEKFHFCLNLLTATPPLANVHAKAYSLNGRNEAIMTGDREKAR